MNALLYSANLFALSYISYTSGSYLTSREQLLHPVTIFVFNVFAP